VNQLDWGILGAGLLAFIFSFMSYYNYSSKGNCGQFCVSFNNSAWHGFFGWFGVLLILIAAGLVAMALFAPQIKLPVPNRLAALGLWALGTLCIILTLFIYPGSASYNGFSGSTSGADKSHGFAFWIVLILAIAGLVVSLMRFQQTGGELPGALGKVPNIGGHAPGGPVQGPPPGYAPPVQGPPPGYAPPAPQGPPPGYAPPPQQGYSPPPPPPQAGP
jgi:hypothetical protein